MTLSPPLNHEDLLTLARKTEAAARDGDRDRLETAALRLFEALLDHVGAERPALLQLPPGETRLLLRGQQRVIDLLVDLAVATKTPGPCRCDTVAQQLLAQLSLQADDERHRLVATASLPPATPAHEETQMSVTEPLRHEHAELLPHLAELDTVAAGLDDWQAGTAQRLDGIVEFLRSHLVPHAQSEEAALYPAVERAMGAPGATDTMKADHVEIVDRIDRLADTVAAVGAGPATVEQTEQLRAQLYGLSAILHLHFTKEEEVLLPVLDTHLNADEAQKMFADMVAAAHPHGGNAT
jgi:hemerythrin-like domain-containing protein